VELENQLSEAVSHPPCAIGDPLEGRTPIWPTYKEMLDRWNSRPLNLDPAAIDNEGDPT
jgi:hypothetical protein